MNFYRIDSISIGGTKHPWAAGWGPLECMPFFQRFAPVMQESKKRFWKVNPRPPGLIVDPGGEIWTDVIGCGGSPPSFFVSDKIVSDLNAAGIRILCATEMPIAKNLSKALKSVPSPKYYVLEAEPGINYAYDLMGLKLDSNGKPIIDRTKKFPESIYSLSTWNGADLFGKRAVFDSTVDLLCTERVKELAERKGWTNIDFKSVKTA
jgi:hypothetical protein